MEQQTSQIQVPTDEQMLAEIDSFLTRTGMPETRFGIEAMREGGLVGSLRKGRSLSIRNANKVVSFMAGWRPDSDEASPASPTKSDAIIREPESGADNQPANIREPGEGIEKSASSSVPRTDCGQPMEADSRGPFSEPSAARQGSLPTCSPTPELPLQLPGSPTCSSSPSKAAA